MGLVYNRVPVGGNDYADGWYSHDEMPPGQQDLEMKHFSVSRDEKKLSPYIVAAQGQMGSGGGGRKQHLFASAWSPPMWMKQNHNFSGCSNGTCSKANPDGCNAGKDGNPPNAMIQDPAGRVLGAYAHYLSLFVSAYKSHGIDVTAMMVQNEPYATGCNYPKCQWTGEWPWSSLPSSADIHLDVLTNSL
jgi:O-glycosyl hydrolase